MFEFTVVGFRIVSFKDEKTGKDVEGFTLFLTRPADNDKVTGLITEKIFISAAYVEYVPTLNDKIVLHYNKYGKISSVQVI